jgi:TPR repeat protein
MTNIGAIYSGGGPGVAKDLGASFTWMKKAADKGGAPAQYNLAAKYYYGLGVAKDLVVARSWFKKSSDQNYSNSQRMLGKMMVKGEGGERLVTQGIIFVEAAAGQGDLLATELLRKHHELLDKSW